MKSKVVISLFVITFLTMGILATVIDSEALAQANNSSSNASSVAPKTTNQKNPVNPINFTGTIPLRSTINKAISPHPVPEYQKLWNYIHADTVSVYNGTTT
jgi:hypothetical protein